MGGVTSKVERYKARFEHELEQMKLVATIATTAQMDALNSHLYCDRLVILNRARLLIETELAKMEAAK